MFRFALVAVFSAVLAVPAMAQRASDALSDALRIGDVVEIMRAEGLDYGHDIQTEMFPGRGGAAWESILDRIYDVATLEKVVRDALDRSLTGEDLAPLEAFFTSERGKRLIGREVAARRALLDTGVEETAREYVMALSEDDPDQYALLERFAEVNDLIDANVVGALNASYAFYTGLADGGAFDASFTQQQIMSDVWGQEEDIRVETQDWVMLFIGLAYQGLEEGDLTAYVEISETRPGKALNRALFDAFDEMYVGISRNLGLGAAQFLNGEDL